MIGRKPYPRPDHKHNPNLFPKNPIITIIHDRPFPNHLHKHDPKSGSKPDPKPVPSLYLFLNLILIMNLFINS